ncbi:hypothetical protein [Streptomyces phaeochromogenes]|uniref:hypothetical protein n=1 Tax=Streptomyces phaeochromogenes TaxID=1923 RepID=UPI002DDADFCD|nr:hypothetical protein [Streptomyces phaeochromogenes]WRZ34704.1 hypothetical protein OG931_46705 [Streptomyces phaeochromogenes]
MHDFARALADQIPGAAPRDVTVHFAVRRQVAAQHGYRSRGGPVTVYAQALHAQLYGLPTDDEPLPAALDALLQVAHTAAGPEQQGAVLQQLAEQLRNAAEILEWARNHAHWRQLPNSAWEWLRDATDHARDLADGIDTVRPAFTAEPPALAAPPQPVPQLADQSAVATTPTPSAGRHRWPGTAPSTEKDTPWQPPPASTHSSPNPSAR